MRTDPGEDPAAATRRRLDEFGRLWAGGPAGLPASEPAVDQPQRSGPAGEHRATGVVPAGVRSSLRAGTPATGLRWHPRHLGLIALAAVLFVLVAIWWTARGAAQPMPVADTTPAAAPVAEATPQDPPSATPSPTQSVTSSATPSAVVVVDVAGKVRRPLVVTLPAGSRVIDAIRRAGGARPGVDLSGINLARVLVDGEQVLVGRRPTRPATAPSSATTGSTGGSASGVSGGKTDLNRASAAELEELPGVGPVTARKIVDWRTEHGAFSSADELLEVDGIGPKTLVEIAPEVTW